MNELENITNLTANVSYQILNSIALLEALEELMTKDLKTGTIIDIIIKQMNEAFSDIEKCRKIISYTD